MAEERKLFRHPSNPNGNTPEYVLARLLEHREDLHCISVIVTWKDKGKGHVSDIHFSHIKHGEMIWHAAIFEDAVKDSVFGSRVPGK